MPPITPFLLLTLAGSAIAQVQPGRGLVVDSATGTPLPGATVTLRDGAQAVVTQRTNDSGRFELRAQRAGTYTIDARAIGFISQTRHVALDSGEAATVVFRLPQLIVALDTVTTQARRGLFGLTPGRELYRRHFERGIGQFISGTEIQLSRLSVIEFLGTIPGLQRVTFIPSPAIRAIETNSPPTIAGRDGFLLSSSGPQCVYARIDHWPLPSLLDAHRSPYLDDILAPEDVVAVEVYLPTEVPPEWNMFLQPTVVIVVYVGMAYFVGDMGPGSASRPTLRTDPRARPNNAPTLGADRYLSENLPLIRAPKCSLVQIWTRIAW